MFKIYKIIRRKSTGEVKQKTEVVKQKKGPQEQDKDRVSLEVAEPLKSYDIKPVLKIKKY